MPENTGLRKKWEGKKQRFALDPGLRDRECSHSHMPYAGKIPCTGGRVCTMCGLRLSDDEYRQMRKDQASLRDRDGNESMTR